MCRNCSLNWNRAFRSFHFFLEVKRNWKLSILSNLNENLLILQQKGEKKNMKIKFSPNSSKVCCQIIIFILLLKLKCCMKQMLKTNIIAKKCSRNKKNYQKMLQSRNILCNLNNSFKKKNTATQNQYKRNGLCWIDGFDIKPAFNLDVLSNIAVIL